MGYNPSKVLTKGGHPAHCAVCRGAGSEQPKHLGDPAVLCMLYPGAEPHEDRRCWGACGSGTTALQMHTKKTPPIQGDKAPQSTQLAWGSTQSSWASLLRWSLGSPMVQESAVCRTGHQVAVSLPIGQATGRPPQEGEGAKCGDPEARPSCWDRPAPLHPPTPPPTPRQENTARSHLESPYLPPIPSPCRLGSSQIPQENI
jgi:hypothetical protein